MKSAILFTFFSIVMVVSERKNYGRTGNKKELAESENTKFVRILTVGGYKKSCSRTAVSRNFLRSFVFTVQCMRKKYYGRQNNDNNNNNNN